MKCAHPTCHRGIGLVSHRRGWFGKRLYCSRDCRDNYVVEVRPPRVKRSFDPSLFEQLFAPANAPAKLVPVRASAMRARAR
jgi:hypothetical protein